MLEKKLTSYFITEISLSKLCMYTFYVNRIIIKVSVSSEHSIDSCLQ